ncbi:MAG: hypothetical protein M2R45_04271 [Verrucomicrobia subdivision 3 bacterium]|nr:hypothetical protein [Limisphaerales bacterium]MCS1417378.1 hypothetical protein [Limisphaerales bacterium]
MDAKNLEEVPSFITKNGSEIHELLAYHNSTIANQSLAEACAPIGALTQEHSYVKTEGIYYTTATTGRIPIEEKTREAKSGDATAIPSGKKHKLWNTGNETQTLLYRCTSCYEHSDTAITEEL